MGIFSNVRKYFKHRRVEKLKKDLMTIRDELQFDPRYIMGETNHETPENFTRRIMEYKVWSMGNSRVLRRMYCTFNFDADSVEKLNYFWHAAPATTRMVHCGIPHLISSQMADILFGGGVQANVVVYSGEGESLKEDKHAEKLANELLTNLYNIMNVHERIATAATNESWGGHCFFKFSHDLSVSQYPILETYDITQAEVVKDRGVTKAIIFKTWYQHESASYRLDEIYSTNTKGEATIQYKLFKCDTDGKIREVGLFDIPQTVEMFCIDGNGNPEGLKLDSDGIFTYEGLKGMLAFEKPNKKPSLEFPSSNYGASDYEGSLDSFDGLDEVYSANVEEIRTNKTKRYLPDVIMPKDDKGRPLPFDEFTNSYVVVKGDLEQDSDNKIEIQQIADKTSSLLDKWKTLLTTVCNNAKLSPYSIGITWLETINPSAESQQERNKVTKDMRKAKLKLWKPLLEEILLRALQLNTWLQQKTNAEQDAFAEVNITWDNAAMQVIFGEYIEDTVESKIATWGGAKMQRVATTETCVREIHPDWTDKQVMDEVNGLRFEDGMSVDTPDGLPQLTGIAEESDDETE